jgi:hypothetical protein
MGTTLNAGWASESITPYGRKVSLGGQYYERLTTEVDCELMATAVAMDNGDAEFTWVSCDLVGVSALLNEEVRTAVIKRASQINTKNIFMCAIHTHTAPYFLKDKDRLPGADVRYRQVEGVMSKEEYHDFIVDRIADAVVKANKNKISGCSVQTGVSPVQTGCCRRGIIDTGEAVMYIDTSRKEFVRMEAPDGGPVNFMYIKDKDGNLKGVISAIPCTAQVLEHQFYMSSDYTGRTRSMLKDKFGEDFFFLPFISAAGDLSPRNLVTKDYGFGNMYDKDGADNMAKRIFDAVIAEEKRAVDTITDFKSFGVAVKRIKLPGWVPTKEEYEWALSIKDTDEVKYDINDYVQKDVEPYFRTPLAVSKKVEAIIARYENSEYYKDVETEICAVRIGDTVWVSNPFELYQEYGSRMITGSKAKSFWTIQLAYDSLGYFPTDYAVKAGGYSAYIQSVRADVSKAGDILVKESIELADSLF